MAFTEAQKLSICKILGVNSIELGVQLSAYSEHITAAVETAVIAEIARWDAGAGTNFVAVRPNTANEGADMDPERAKYDIRKNIGLFLLFPESVWGGSVDSFTIQRG